MVGCLCSRNVKWPHDPVTCVHPPVHSAVHSSCSVLLPHASCPLLLFSPPASLPLPLLLLPPRRYFIKLVKRKYKKDVSTDSRALQARSLFAVFLFVPLACCWFTSLAAACCWGYTAPALQARSPFLPFPVRTPRLLLHGAWAARPPALQAHSLRSAHAAALGASKLPVLAPCCAVLHAAELTTAPRSACKSPHSHTLLLIRPRVLQKLRREAERAKRALSSQHQV